LAGVLAVGCVLTSSTVLPVTAIPTAIMTASAEETTGEYYWDANTTFTLSEDGTVATLHGEGALQPATTESKYKEDVARLKNVTTIQFSEDSHFTAFGYKAFESVSNLQDIIIPDTVDGIADGAFSDNFIKQHYDENGFAWADNWILSFKAPDEWEKDSVSQLVIPEKAVGIADEAFQRKIKKQVVGTGCFTDNVTIIINSNLKYIGAAAFHLDDKITDVHIPDDSQLERIGDYAFDWTGITFTDNTITKEKPLVFYVGSYYDEEGNPCGLNWAVQMNYSSNEFGEDKTVVIADYVNDRPVVGVQDGWSDSIVDGTPSGISVVFPSTLRHLGNVTRSSHQEKNTGNNHVISVTFPDDCELTRIKDYTFVGTKLTEIQLPKNVTQIDEFAFSDCTDLKTVILPENLQIIKNSAFANCKSLEEIQFPDGVQSIGDWAFAGCKALKEITIPENVTEIGEGAFSYKVNATDNKDYLPKESIQKITILNPDCQIAENIHTLDSVLIYGYLGSTAETFCHNVKEFIENTTCRVFIPLNPETKVPYEFGDINMDGEISVTDAVKLQKYLHKKETIKEYQFNLVDLNQDGKVNIYDLALLKRILLNK